MYQFEVYRLVQFFSPFASYTRKVYQLGVCQLVLVFLPFTYLLRAFVSAQGCISYRRKTCSLKHPTLRGGWLLNAQSGILRAPKSGTNEEHYPQNEVFLNLNSSSVVAVVTAPHLSDDPMPTIYR